MRKRLWCVLLTVALLLTLFPTAALAEEPEEDLPPEDGAVEVQTETVTLDDEDWDSDMMFALYVDQIFGLGGPAGISTGDERAYETLSDIDKKIYDKIDEGVTALLAGTRTNTEFSLEGIPYGTYDSNKIFSAYLKDHPYEMFWMDKTTGARMSLSYNNGTLLNGSVYKFAVSADYSASGNKGTYNVDVKKISAAVTAKANADKIIADAANKGSVYDKLKFLNDEICRLTSYNYDALQGDPPYGDPWQLIWVFDNDPATKVVCEGYAKAFQYLCDNVFSNGNVQCYTVSGEMGAQGGSATGSGPHMWNVVSIDEANYLVDVTNCDEDSIGAPYNLFLAGSNGPESGYWNVDSSYTIHIGSSIKVHYLYDDSELWPLTLSTTSYKPAGAPESVTVTCTTTQEVGVKDHPEISGFNKPEYTDLNTPGTKSLQFTAAVTGSSTPADITWSLSGAGNAANAFTLTPSADGTTATLTIKTDANISYGQRITVTATCASVSGSAQICIFGETLKPKFIQILKDNVPITSDSIASGESASYTAKVYNQYGNGMTDQTVNWTSSPSDVASVSGSTVTALKQGTTTVSASCEGVTTTLGLTVTKGVATASKIEITPESASVTVPSTNTAETVSFTAKVTDQDNDVMSDAPVAWSISSALPSGMTFSEGTLTVTKEAAAGLTATGAQYTVTATVQGTNVSGSATVTVKRAEAKASAIKFFNGSQEVSGTVIVGIPSTTTFTAKTYDQYGDEIDDTALTISGSETGVTVSGNTATITVAEGSNETSYTLTAQSGAINATLNVESKNVVISWDALGTPAGITYGQKPSSAFGTLRFPVAGTAKYPNGDTVNGNFTVDDTASMPAGTPSLVVTFTENGTGKTYTKTYQVNVAQRAISNAAVSVSGTCTYTGAAQTPAVTVTDSGAAITASDYRISYADNTAAGTAKVTITGQGNYQGTKEATFKINPIALTVTGATATDKTYDGTAQVEITGVTLNGAVSTDDVSVNTTGLKGTLSGSDAGDYSTVTLPSLTLTGAAKGNYTLTQPTGAVSTTVTISPKAVTNPTIELDKEKYGYTGAQIQPKVTVKDGGTTIPSDQYTVTYGTNTESGAIAGSVTIANKANGNYAFSGTLTKNFEIVPQTAVVTPDKNAYTVAYGNTVDVKITVTAAPAARQNSRASAPAANQVALFNGEKQVTEPQNVTPGTPMTFKVDTKAAGLTPDDYTLTAKYIASQNLSAGEATATLKVTPRTLTPVLSGTATKTFDNTTDCSGTRLTISLNGVLDGENVTVTAAGYAYDSANAGTGKTITASGLTLGGANEGSYQLSASTVSAAVGAITRASRSITVTPSALTLLPDDLDGTIKAEVTEGSDLDNSAAGNWDYSLTGDVTAITLNTATGAVKAVGNGTVTLTVKVKATDNYAESNAVTVTITAIKDPVLGITGVTSSVPTDQLTGTLKDGKVIVSGFLTQGANIDDITAQTADGVTVVVNGNKLEATYGDAVIARYDIDTTNVVEVNSKIDLDEGEKAAGNDVTGGNATVAETAVKDSETKVEGLLASAAQGLQGLATRLEEQKAAEISETMGEDPYTIKVETSVEITAKELTIETNTNVFKLDIKPVVKVTAEAKGDSTKTVSLQDSSTLPNSYIKTEVTVSVKLPAGFPTTNLYARHYLTGGGTEILPVTVDTVNRIATWKQSSFSETELFSDGRSGTVTFRNEDGTVNSQTYTFQNIGDSLPEQSRDGSDFDGWQINGTGTAYKEITEAFLTAIKGGVTLEPKFTPKTPDPGPGPGPGPDPVDPTPTPTPTPSTPGGGSGSSGGSSSGRHSSGGSAATPGMVSISGASHGTVSVSPKNPTKGKTVTLTVRPNSGYVLDSVKVTDSKGAEVALTKVGDTQYTFVMPSGKVTVDASFVSDGSGSAAFPFADAAGSWARDAIAWAYENGYMNGVSAAAFQPDGTITRQQLWMILARLNGQNPANMAEARQWAMSSGVSDGTNGANAMTRQQMVTFLYRYGQQKGYALTGAADLGRFPDSGTVSGYAQAPFAWAVENGIVSGTSQGTLNPGGSATRAQFAVILQRFYANIVEG